MTETYAEDLQQTAEKAVTATDAYGKDLKPGDTVVLDPNLVQDDITTENGRWVTVPGRPFDQGEVEGVNSDGTVNVFWESAGCSCTSENGRVEKGIDLVRLNDTEDLPDIHFVTNLIRAATTSGIRDGIASNQQQLRDVLGLPHPSPESDN